MHHAPGISLIPADSSSRLGSLSSAHRAKHPMPTLSKCTCLPLRRVATRPCPWLSHAILVHTYSIFISLSPANPCVAVTPVPAKQVTSARQRLLRARGCVRTCTCHRPNIGRWCPSSTLHHAPGLRFRRLRRIRPPGSPEPPRLRVTRTSPSPAPPRPALEPDGRLEPLTPRAA